MVPTYCGTHVLWYPRTVVLCYPVVLVVSRCCGTLRNLWYLMVTTAPGGTMVPKYRGTQWYHGFLPWFFIYLFIFFWGGAFRRPCDTSIHPSIHPSSLECMLLIYTIIIRSAVCIVTILCPALSLDLVILAEQDTQTWRIGAVTTTFFKQAG